MLNEIKSLPPLPASIVRIQELCMSNETDIDELSFVIESDPMLSANILKSVNSPLYGMSKEIASISQAVMLFGISMIRGFAAASAIKKAVPIDLSPYGIAIEDLTRISSVQTALVKEWYRHVDKSMLPLLQSCAFLMELGKLVIALKVIAQGDTERFHAEISAQKPIGSVEIAFVGVDSYAAAAMMFEHWNFETALVDALKGISDPSGENPYSKVLSVMAKATDLHGSITESTTTDLFVQIERCRLDRAACEEALLSLKSRIF